MWVPTSSIHIEQALAIGELEETPNFDGKASLPQPKKNVDLAVDVAAMTAEGGVLIYGVGEDENGRLTTSSPIPLAGAAERVGQIVATCIAEVPHIDVQELPLTDDPTRGYLVVVVPQSARAPHQVTVGGDLRFYGRGAKGNRRLTEGDVARLYERRETSSINRDELLRECIELAPFGPDPSVGYVHAFARPVASDDDLWDRAILAYGHQLHLQRALAEAAGQCRVTSTYSPSLGEGSLDWQPQGADAWRVSKWRVPDYTDPAWVNDPTSLAEVTVSIDGRGRVFCGRATDEYGEGRVIMEVVVAGTVAAFLSMMAALYRASGYFGQVDVGVAVTNLEGAGSLRLRRNHERISYGAATFTKTRRWASSALLEPEERTRDLLGRFFATSTGLPSYDPFTDLA